ncbi:MAG TPA: hypothetical protein ENI27_03445 [bacterium]|nr:hypothetical protein [bacterium]
MGFELVIPSSYSEPGSTVLVTNGALTLAKGADVTLRLHVQIKDTTSAEILYSETFTNTINKNQPGAQNAMLERFEYEIINWGKAKLKEENIRATFLPSFSSTLIDRVGGQIWQ